MSITFRTSRLQRLRTEIRARCATAMDFIYSPVIERLTTDEYFACTTRNDCLRTYLRRRMRVVLI